MPKAVREETGWPTLISTDPDEVFYSVISVCSVVKLFFGCGRRPQRIN
jgi:hypothetical protein